MLNDKKIIAADYAGKDIEGIEGDYVAGQSTTLKRRFDALSKEVIAPKHNELIDELQADSAAAEIGATPLNSNSGNKVQDILAYLWEQMQKVTQGAIPDGSITAAKFADGSITNEKLADNAVTGEKISTGAVGADEIAEGAIGEEKLAQALAEKLAAFVTDGTFQEALLEKAARIHQHAPSDITDTMPIEKGGTGATSVVEAQQRLEIFPSALYAGEAAPHERPLGAVAVYDNLAEIAWYRPGMSTLEFLTAMPQHSAIVTSTNTMALSDQPTTYATYFIHKGFGTYYNTVTCKSANSKTLSKWEYACTATEGVWTKTT